MKKIHSSLMLQAVFTTITVFVNAFSFAQLSNPPAIQWQNISWTDEDVYDNEQDQDASGEDWWYNHANVYDGGGNQTGYVTCGYTSLILKSVADYNQAQTIFNEGNNSPFNPITHVHQTSSGAIVDNYDFTSSYPEGCIDRDYVGEHRTPTRGNAALNDLQGNMLWCKAYCVGELGGIIQDGNYFYIVGIHAGIKSQQNISVALPYNGNPSNTFAGLAGPIFGDIDGSVKTRHLYITKIDMSGTVVWEGLYGMVNYVISPYSAMTAISYGYSIIKASNGNLIATGYADAGAGFQPFIVEVDPTTGGLINKNVIPLPTNVNSSGLPCFQGESHAVTEIAGQYAVACVFAYGSPSTSTFNYSDYNHAAVCLVDASLNLSSSWTTNPIDLAGSGVNPDPLLSGYRISSIFDIKYSSTKNELLVPVSSNCRGCLSAGDNTAAGLIYRFDNAGSLKSGTNPSQLGMVHAFDLRIGVAETSDGGFIATSSTQRPSVIGANPLPTSAELGYLAGCIDLPFSYPVWDTDPIVAKFKSNGDKVWEKIFDIYDDRPRQNFPGDLKREECLYKITEAQDGGYVVSGNCSYNFDDNYLFKLYNDCNVNQNFTVSDPTDNIIDISGSVIWSGSKLVLGSVNILSGATLTIAPGAIIQFADTKLTGIITNINVQKAGKLIVQSGAVLTSIITCPTSMWDGIIVQGTTAKQLAANQGWVALTSCEINNARRGVFVGGIVKNSGGVLQAAYATFRNNFIDVEFAPYAAPLNTIGNEPNNISYFSFCNFIGDKYLNDPSYFGFLTGVRLTNQYHVLLRGIKGIQFSGNSFKTDLTGTLGSSYQTDQRSIGIYSIDANFNVHRACNIIGPDGCAGLPNNFDNLYYGVYAQSTSGLKAFTVTQTNFTNCYNSLFQSGTNYSTVTKNSFVMNSTIAAPIVPICVGSCPNYFDYTNQCSGFVHSENSYSVTSSQQMIGSVFNNLGTNANETYHNTYTGLKIGNQTQKTNGVNATVTGLQIRCNTNSGVATTDISSTSGVIPNQGACGTPTSPSNNLFSTTSLPDSDIKVATVANNFIYSYSALPAGPQVPVQFTVSKVTLGPCGGPPFNATASCPTPVPCGFPCWFALAISNNSSANNAKQVLLDGDAPALYSAIGSTMDIGSLKTLLMNKSPYLSDGVIIAYLQRTTSPTPGQIKQVIVANSPVTDPVLAVLNSITLPTGIRNLINAAQTGVSKRKQQEDLVDYFFSEKELSINGAVRELLNDTITPNTDSIIGYLLKWDGTIKGKNALVELYIDKGDYSSAQTLIDSISGLPGMDKHGTLLQHRKNLKAANKDWFEINNDGALEADIEELSNDSLADGFANARSILALVKGHKNYDFVEEELELHSQIIAQQPQEEIQMIETQNDVVKLSAYPNPSDDIVNVLVDISEEIQPETYVQLIDPVSGRIIQQHLLNSSYSELVFNTETLSSGIYLIGVKGTAISPTFIKVIKLK